MMLDEIINRTVTSLCISQSLAKLLLEMNQWDEIKITELYKSDRQRLLIGKSLAKPEILLSIAVFSYNLNMENNF